MRVAIFGSFYRGYYLLDELIGGPLRGRLQVVGLATDDPAQSFVSPGRRVWQYPHTRQEELMVAELAAAKGIPVYQGRVKTPEFYDLFERHWRPDLCLMGTFGQRIDERLRSWPPLGFFNFHPGDDGPWPSRYAGSNPFQMLLEDGVSHCRIHMHTVDEAFDAGTRVGLSDPIRIPPGATVVDLHKLTSLQAALLARRELLRLLDNASAGPDRG